jgi:cathepsin E
LSSTAGIVDTGTTLLLLATDAFNKYKSATGAVLDSTTGLLRITSSQYANLKSLFFTINGVSLGSTMLVTYSDLLCVPKVTYEFTANAQIWPRALNSQIGGTSGNIYLVAADIGSNSGSGLDFINGYAFLERFYSVFDTANKRVGFATTPNTKSTSN